MVVKNIQELVGKVIEFNDNCQYHEQSPFEKGMKALVTKVELSNEYTHVILLYCDFAEFEEYNKKFMTESFFLTIDPTPEDIAMKWCDTPYYPKNHKTIHTDYLADIVRKEQTPTFFNVLN